jgi:hypothetical protein
MASANASPPVVTKFHFVAPPDTLTNLCSFPVVLNATLDGTRTDYVDANGNPTFSDFHSIEQDVFSANGVTLTATPYVNQQKWIYDSSGNIVHAYYTGVVERIPLPDGDTFLSVGRIDQVTSDNPAALTPDVGRSGDLVSLCAALAG